MKLPLISVIIPTHNRPLLLRRAIQSIKNQSSIDALEIIVVSDSVSQETDLVCYELLGAGDIYIRRNGKPGPSASRNLGMSLSSGSIVMFLDDDDAWHSGIFGSLYGFFCNQPAQPVYFNCSIVKERRINGQGHFIGEQFLDQSGRLTTDVFVKNQVHMSCFAFPKTLIQELKFDCSMRAYEDWDFLLAVFEREFPVFQPFVGSQIFEVDDESSDRRGSSESAVNFNAVLDYLYVYRRHPAPSYEVAEKRAKLLASVSLPVPIEMVI